MIFGMDSSTRIFCRFLNLQEPMIRSMRDHVYVMVMTTLIEESKSGDDPEFWTKEVKVGSDCPGERVS